LEGSFDIHEAIRGGDFMPSGNVFHARRSFGVGVLLALALGVGSPVHAQDDTGAKFPIEFLQGFSAKGGAAVQPYAASVAAIPGYSFGGTRLSLRLSADYENPGWTARIGPRISRQVGPSMANIGLILGAEATSNFDGGARVGAGLTFDVDGLLRVGLWGGWDEVRDGGWFGIMGGFDPASWFGCVKGLDGNCYGDQQ
jgi:hypothetical protein